MASDFEISIEWNRDYLHLDLSGDFDGQSASRLIEYLRTDCRKATVVFIRANGLDNICPSGRDAFLKDLHVLEDFRYRLVFTDGSASLISSGWIEYF